MIDRRRMLTTLAGSAGILSFLDLTQTCQADPPKDRERTSRLKSDKTAADLRRIANDSSATREKRAEAVFGMFANHLKLPQDAAPVRKVLGDVAWLKDSELFGFYFLAGKVPVEMNLKDTVFAMHLFLGKKEYSDWVIFFRLSGGNEREVKEAKAFLRGDKDLAGKPQLMEFALCFPSVGDKVGGPIERFGEKGITFYDQLDR
jgi:hypothetical protein